MSRFHWATIVLSVLVLALVINSLHISSTTNTTVIKANYERQQMSAIGCEAIRQGEPEAVIRAMYGTSQSAGSDTIDVTYPYDEDFYSFGSPDQECDVYYDADHRVKLVYEELLP